MHRLPSLPACRAFCGINGIQNPLPLAAPDPPAGFRRKKQYHLEVETILCRLQMNYIERTLLHTKFEKKNPKKPAARSRGCLLVKRQNESPQFTVARTNPRFRVRGSSWRKESLPLIFARLKIPQSGPILRTKILQKRNVAFPKRGNTQRLQEPVLNPVACPD